MAKKIICGSLPIEIGFQYPHGVARISWRPGKKTGDLQIFLDYNAAYGMGEKFNTLNHKGSEVASVVEEKFCFQGDKTYCPSPFFWTDSGFGFYAGTTDVTRFRFNPQSIDICLPVASEPVFFSGSPETIVSDYMLLFGHAKLPPKWAFGPWISANHWDSRQKLESAVLQACQYGFPVCATVIEAWSDEATFYIFRGAKYTPKPGGEAFELADFDFASSPWPNPAEMIRRLHSKGIRLLLWQIPVYKKQSPDEPQNEQNQLDWADAEARGLCVRTLKGSPYTIPDGNWFAGSMIPDFTNPLTVKTWFAKRKYLTDLGIDGFKTDGGEFIYCEDLQFFDGTTGREGKNRYSQDYIGAYSQKLRPGQALFSRAGYSGQHTTPIHWAGDQQSQSEEMRSVLRAGLSAAATGIPFWGFDIAGFAGPLPTPDYYRRATQLGCFTPIMQWHSEPDGGQFKELMPGGEGNNERSPWNIATAYGLPEFIDEMRFWHNLRMNLMPYLYSTALECTEQSKPMLRPLAYVWPHDQDAREIDDQFMLGTSLLVAPFMQENADSRTVYLPEGCWVELFRHALHGGKQRITAGSTIRLPVFIREGTAVLLNLGESGELGSSVGNQIDAYTIPTLLIAGEFGNQRFRDDAGSDFIVRWKDACITFEGRTPEGLVVKRMGSRHA